MAKTEGVTECAQKIDKYQAEGIENCRAVESRTLVTANVNKSPQEPSY